MSIVTIWSVFPNPVTYDVTICIFALWLDLRKPDVHPYLIINKYSKQASIHQETGAYTHYSTVISYLKAFLYKATLEYLLPMG